MYVALVSVKRHLFDLDTKARLRKKEGIGSRRWNEKEEGREGGQKRIISIVGFRFHHFIYPRKKNLLGQRTNQIVIFFLLYYIFLLDFIYLFSERLAFLAWTSNRYGVFPESGFVDDALYPAEFELGGDVAINVGCNMTQKQKQQMVSLI